MKKKVTLKDMLLAALTIAVALQTAALYMVFVGYSKDYDSLSSRIMQTTSEHDKRLRQLEK